MRLVVFSAFVAACSSSVDPNVEAEIAAMEKLVAEAEHGDCAAIQGAFDPKHVSDVLSKVDAGGPLAIRVQAAAEKAKPLVDECVAPKPAEPAAAPPTEPAPAEPVAAPPAPTEAPAEAPTEAPAEKGMGPHQ